MVRRSLMWRALQAGLVLFALTVAGHSAADDRELAESPDFRVRVQAALRLGRAGGKSAREDLERGLRDAHPAVRVSCAVALGTMGDASSIPAIERAARSESNASVKTSMEEVVAKLRKAAKEGTGGGDSAHSVESAKYVVQLGTMRNNSGLRNDIDNVMRSAARSRANTIKGAFVLDNADATVLRRATDKKVPVLLVDGTLTRLSQSTARDGGVIVSAQVDVSIRRVPQQTLRGMVSGSASAMDSSRAQSSPSALAELQNRAVNGAVESALSRVSADIANLAK